MRANFGKIGTIATTGTGYLLTATTVFAQGEGGTTPNSGRTTNASGITDVAVGPGWADNVGSLITSVLSIVMVIALVLVLVYLIWGGIGWITAGGDKGKTEEARNKITAAVIGIIILAAAWAIVNFVAFFLGYGSFNEIFNNITQINEG